MAKLVAFSQPMFPATYLSKYFGITGTNIFYTDKLREWLDHNGHEDLWDKPLDEIDEVITQEHPVVLVVDRDYVDYRWFEIPED